MTRLSIPRGATLAAVLFGALCANAGAAPAALSAGEIRELTAEQLQPALALYREFLSLPNDAAHPDDMRRVVEWLERAFGARGFRTERLPTGGSPLRYAERRQPGADKTVLVYLQADGQPVDRAAWFQDDPFQPALKERGEDGNWREIPWQRLTERLDPDWRIFARSASDSKGPMTQFMSAVSALDRAAHPYIVSFEYEVSYRAFRSDFDALAGRMARAGMRHLYGQEPIMIRTMGGSIPIAPFVTTLAIPAATVATVNIDNNQHSPNENIKLGFFIEGISIIMSVLSQVPR